MRYEIRYVNSSAGFAKFVSGTDAKDFLAMIRKMEPGIQFYAFDSKTGERMGW